MHETLEEPPPVPGLPPEPPQKWTEPRECTRFSASCPQPSSPLVPAVAGTQDEDCLYLNVWTAGRRGDERPVLVEIHMNNSSGIYQVDGLLKAKLRGSGLEPYVEVVARIDTEAEKRLVPVYRLET